MSKARAAEPISLGIHELATNAALRIQAETKLQFTRRDRLHDADAYRPDVLTD